MKTLFCFDDHEIPFRSNLDLTMLPGVKYANNPVLKRGLPTSPDARWARLWAGTVLYEQGKFRMWYSGADSIEQWMKCEFSLLYAESDDGITWHKPALGLVKYRGSRENNLVQIDACVEMPAIMRDDGPDVPAGERYKMFSEIHNAREPEAFLAVSPDGLRWTIVSHPRHRGVSLYRFQGHYHSAFVQYGPELPGGFPGGRVMGVVRSGDFREWSSPPCLGFHRADYTTNPPDISEQVHSPAGFWNRENIMVGVYGQIHQTNAKPGTKFARSGSGMEDTREDLGFFMSNDGLHYREPIPGFKIVPRGMEGQWDGGSLVPAHAFVNTEAHTYLYYGAWDNGMCFDTAAGDVGMAFWRRDGFGFVRIRDASQEAILQTQTIRRDGGDVSVYVNFDIHAYAPGCGLQFAVVDSAGRPMEGFAFQDCLTNTDPGLKQPVRWKDHPHIPASLPGDLQLRIRFLTNGNANPYQPEASSPLLYCLYLEESPL